VCQIKIFHNPASFPFSQITFAPMEVFALIVFWSSVLGLAHTYMFYPLLMRTLAASKQANMIRYDPDDPDLPDVCILMSVYNEERVIGEKLHSLFALNYPPGKVHLYIGSDCSNDGTAALIRAFIGEHPDFPIRFYDFPHRRGKPPVINELAQSA